jgi:peptidoglycan/LPS O-acetylase OafA/YrhL
MCLLAPVLLFFAGQNGQLGLHMEVLSSTRLGLERAATWGGFAVCLVGIVTYLDLNIFLNWPRILLLLGDASYSIYLITPIVMTPTAILVHSLRHFHLLASILETEIISGLFYLTGTIVGGVILWKYYELPVSTAAKKFLLPASNRSTKEKI